MDRASAHGAGDCRFESCRGHCARMDIVALDVTNIFEWYQYTTNSIRVRSHTNTHTYVCACYVYHVSIDSCFTYQHTEHTPLLHILTYVCDLGPIQRKPTRREPGIRLIAMCVRNMRPSRTYTPRIIATCASQPRLDEITMRTMITVVKLDGYVRIM